jgi:uncharacterized repeat protein (TIGR01451 family)
MLSLFPSRSFAAGAKRSARTRRGTLRSRQRGLGTWERLGLGLGDLEQLEQRSLMAADLSLSFNDNLAAGIERVCYVPGNQVSYTLTLTNNGNTAATDVLVKTTLASPITGKTWSALYTGGGTGPNAGAGDLGTHTDQKAKADFSTKVTLPAGATATFKIVGTIPGDATGKLTSTAAVTLGSDTKTATDEDAFVPKSIAVGSNGSWTTASTVKLVDSVTGKLIAEPVTPFPGLRTGVRAVMSDLTGDGKPEVAIVSNYGTAAQLAVYSQKIAADGTVTLVRDPSFSLLPFGSDYAGGMTVAAGDFNGDKIGDLAFGQSSGAGAVKVYLSTPLQPASPLTSFRTFTPFAVATGGVSLGAGDFGTFSGASSDPLLQDGVDELVVTSGVGDAPSVQIYSLAATTPAVVDTIKPFTPSFKNGFAVEVAPFNADSKPDLMFTAASGGRSAVEIFDGSVGTAANKRLAKFTVFSGIGSGSAVFAAAVDSNGDTRADTINFVQGGGKGSPMVRYSVGIGTTPGSITPSKIDTVAAVAGTLRAAAASIQADPSMIRTTTGLIYQELVKGNGASYSSTSTGVKVNYKGYTSEGDLFDSGTNSSFSLSGVIPGFAEGLKKTKVGGTAKLIIAADLAYGNAAPSNGKPIIFIVDLLAFTP